MPRLRPLHLLAAVLSFTLVAACGDDDDDGGDSTTVVLDGNWVYTVDVTVANGVCAGEENDEVDGFPVEITVTDQGDGTYLVTISGFIDDPSNVVTGTVTGVPEIGDDITLTGSYPEDGGVTTTTHHLTVDSENGLTGTEQWSWTGPGGTCEGGEADLSLDRT